MNCNSLRALLVIAMLAALTGTAWAQKPPPPWEITEVKASGKAPAPNGSEVTKFDGDGKEFQVFLHVTLTFRKAPMGNTILGMQVIDKKKKPVGKIFNVGADKADKKIVTVIFEGPMAWDSLADLQLKGYNHTAPLQK